MSEAFRDAFRKALEHGADCPPVETLLEMIEHGASGDRAGVENHLRFCPACQTEVSLYRTFEAGAVRADERSAVDFIVKRLAQETTPPARQKGATASFWQRLFTPAWMGGAALAMAAILVGVGLLPQMRLRHGVEPAMEDQTLRTGTLTVTSPRGDLAEAPNVFEWKPVEGAAEYAVVLSEVDRHAIFYKKVTSSRLLVPVGIRTLIVPGKTVLLEVKAEDGQGRVIAQSGAIRFRIKTQ